MRLTKFAMLACASMIAPAMAAAPPSMPAIILAESQVVPSNPRRKMRGLDVVRGGYRSRGPQAKPKGRRNMVTVGRRVRRKHRRAA